MRIVLDELSFGYTRQKSVFSGVSADLPHFPLAVLGPNGAGKSTLLALLAGQLNQTSGNLAVESAEEMATKPGDLRRITSFMPQDVHPIRGFAARDQVAYNGWLKGMSRRRCHDAAEEALDMVGLSGQRNIAVSKLSGGQRRRLGIASAAISSPALLLLDEPHAGLDPEHRGAVRTALRALDGVSLVISTHQTEDLDDFYEGVLVIDEGRIAFAGTTAEFLKDVPDETAGSVRAEVAYRAVIHR